MTAGPVAAPLRVGVIGTGFGAQVQIPAFQAHPRARVVAVASAQPGRARRAAERFGIPQAFDRWEALVDAELDLVSITTPPHLHHPMAIRAAGLGRHVLCEKPMALSVSEAQAMTEAAGRAGVVAVIDHELRVNPNRRRARALLEAGYVGRPRLVQLTLLSGGRASPARAWDWWSDAERGGGILGAVGSHQIDLLRHWLGEPTAAAGGLATFVGERPRADGDGRQRVTSDDSTVIMLRFASGALASVLLSAVVTRGVGPRIEVWGDAGALWLGEDERLWGLPAGARDPRELTEPETLPAPPGMEYASLWGLSFVRLVDHLVAAVLDGGPVAPLATFGDGLVVQQALDAVHRASRDAWVPLA